METYLGIDLGGTKLLIGEIDCHGNILRYKQYETGHHTQREYTQIIMDSLDDYQTTVGWWDAKPLAMGIGVIGRVDTQQGIWLQIDPDRSEVIALSKLMFDRYEIPCYIDNDVKSATTAEQIWGFGQNSDNFIYISIGTGIACSTVLSGRQIRGSHYNAGEVGHTRVGVNVGVQCSCGRMDCVEAIASGSGLDQCARLLKEQYKTALILSNHQPISANDVFQLCKTGDPLCEKIVDNAAQALANLIMNLVRVVDPDAVVLGGGIITDGFLYPKIISYLNPRTMRFVSNGVVITKLNPTFIGMIGAAAIAIYR